MTLSFLAFLALAAWIWLAFARSDFWRAAQRLRAAPEPGDWPEIVAVIPARDEAETIGAVIAAHEASDYPGAFSIVLVDDGSTDGTADFARRAGEDGTRALHIVDAPPLEEGWSGKVAAQKAGVEAAARLAPEARYVLFCDADIEFAPETLRRLVAKAEAEKLALASLMARLDARGDWASILIPAFVYFFQKLYPFPRANNPGNQTAAAAGGCMLARRDALEASGGIEAIKDALIDDCALARRLKHHGVGAPRATWIGLADREAVSLRDNRDPHSIWRMTARTAYAQLDRSPLKLAGTVLGMIVLYIVPPVAALFLPFHGDWAAAGFGAAAWAIMAATFYPTAKLYGLAPLKAFLLPVAGAAFTAMTLSSALQHYRGDGAEWKGRAYR